MTYQEAARVARGTQVIYRGKVTEVLSVERRGPYAIYFRLAGVAEPVSFASVMLANDMVPRKAG